MGSFDVHGVNMIAPDSPSISSNFHSITAFLASNEIPPNTPIHQPRLIVEHKAPETSASHINPSNNIVRTWSLGFRKSRVSPAHRSRSASQPSPDDSVNQHHDHIPHSAPLDEQCEPEYDTPCERRQSTITPQLSARARAALGPYTIFAKSSISNLKSSTIKRWRSQIAPLHSPARRRWFMNRASMRDTNTDKADSADVPVSTPWNDDYNNLDVDYLNSQSHPFSHRFTESQLEHRWHEYFELNHADNIRRIMLYGIPLWFITGLVFDAARNDKDDGSRSLIRLFMRIIGTSLAIFCILLMYHPQHHSHSRWRKLLARLTTCQSQRISSATSSAFVALVVGITESLSYSLEGDATVTPLILVLLLLISLSPTAFRHSTLMSATVNCILIMCYLIISISLDAFPSVLQLVYPTISLLGMTVVFVSRASQIEARDRSEFLAFCHLQQEEQVSQRLLLKMMPLSIIGKLRAGAEYVYEKHEKVSVLFSHIHDFDLHTASMQPIQLVKTLNRIFSLFDELTDQHQVYKVETIGDVFLVCSGCPQEYARSDHAFALAILAVDMMAVIRKFSVTHDEIRRSSIFKLEHQPLPDLRPIGTPAISKSHITLRIGINTGPVIAGVIGRKHPRYRLMGDTINTASRMSTTCAASEIQISSTTHDELDADVFNCEARTVEVKGKGLMHTFIVKGHNLQHHRSASRLAHIHTSPQIEMSRRAKISQATSHHLNTSFPGLVTDDSNSPSSRVQAFRFDVEPANDGHDGDELVRTIRAKSAQVTHLVPERSESEHNASVCVSAAPSNAVSRRPSECRPDSVDQMMPIDDKLIRASTWHNPPAATFQLPTDVDQVNCERGIGRTYQSRSKSPSIMRHSPVVVPASESQTHEVVQNAADIRKLIMHMSGRQVIAATQPKSSISLYTDVGTPSSFRHSSNDCVDCSPSSSPHHSKHVTMAPAVPIDSHSLVSALEVDSPDVDAATYTAEHSPSTHLTRFDLPTSHPSPAAASLVPVRSAAVHLSPGSRKHTLGGGRSPMKLSSHHLQDSSADELESADLVSVQFKQADSTTKRHRKADVVITAQSENVKDVKMFTYGDLLSLVDAPRPWAHKLGLTFLDHDDLEWRFQIENRAKMGLVHQRWLQWCLVSSAVCVAYEIVQLVSSPSVTDIVVIIILRLIIVLANVALLYSRGRTDIKPQQCFTIGLAFACAQCAIFILVNRTLDTFNSPFGDCGVLIILSIGITFTGLPIRHSIVLVTICFFTWVVSAFAFSQHLSWGIVISIAGAFMYLLTTYVSEHHDRALFLHVLKHEGEKATTKQLLNNLLPKQVIDSLTAQRDSMTTHITFIAHERLSADVLFCDVVQFTRMAARSSPEDVVAILNVLFSTFDGLMDKYNVYKVETIGDAYLACSGVVEERADHTKCLVACGLAMRRATRLFRTPYDEAIVVRVGIHTGFVIAGVVGRKMPRYHLFGETVSIAEEMEQRAPAGQVVISETTYNAMSEVEQLQFDMTPLDAIHITCGAQLGNSNCDRDGNSGIRELGRYLVRTRSTDADRQREHASKKRRQHYSHYRKPTFLVSAIDDINAKLKGLRLAQRDSSIITETSSTITSQTSEKNEQ